MNKYTLVAENQESTVVAEYQPLYPRESSFQSETELEKAFIEQLQAQAYEYLPVTTEQVLIGNLRKQLETLNSYPFSDSEWDQFFKGKIANQNNGIVEKTTIIQEDYIQLLTRDDGTVKNIYLIDKMNIHNNRLQVINQYEVENGHRANRYDITVLVNGFPLVHIELKKRGVDIKEAFGTKLHTYTIVDAITDKNVLPFRIDYISTMREQENIQDEKVWNIDREKALAAPERISNIVNYIREHFDQKTKRNSYYQLKDRRLAGFNSIFAVSSIDMDKKYYAEFQNQMTDLPSDKQLKVATIYSFGVNENDPEIDGIIEDENLEDTSKLDQSSRDFLDAAIKDFKTKHITLHTYTQRQK